MMSCLIFCLVLRANNATIRSNGKFQRIGDLVAKFWQQHKSFNILRSLASRIGDSSASSSMIERSFSRVGRFVTKESNRWKSASLGALVQIGGFETFQETMRVILAQHNIKMHPISLLSGGVIEDVVANPDRFDEDDPYGYGLLDTAFLHSDE